MKKVFIAIVVLLAVAGIAVLTCPDKAAHKEAIRLTKVSARILPKGMKGLPSLQVLSVRESLDMSWIIVFPSRTILYSAQAR